MNEQLQKLSKKKKIAFTVITVLLLLLCAEAFFRFVINQYNRLGTYEKKTTFAAYKNKPWVDGYFKDIEECGKQTEQRKGNRNNYVRFVLHDEGEDCNTTYLNYDRRTRKTWNPDATTFASARKVFQVGVFGGSTVEGLGTIDDETIPSNLSKILNASGTKDMYQVTNYGVSSYTFTQSVMKLITLLREGTHFDYVIFYGGGNDIDNTYTTGEVGALFAETALKLKLQGSWWDQAKDYLWQQVNICGTCRAVIILSRNTPFLKDHITPYLVKLRDFILFKKGEQQNDAGIEKMSKDIATYYEQSHNLLNAISRAYGFRYFDFWQPTLLYRDSPLPNEENLANIDPRLSDEKMKHLYALTSDQVNRMSIKNFFDISDALQKRTAAYFLDAVHINDSGNQDVAKAIANIFEKNKYPLPLPQ